MGRFLHREKDKQASGMEGTLKPYKTTEKSAGLFLSIPATSVADPDPGSSAFLIPGSGIRDPGWVKSQDLDLGSGLNNPDHISGIRDGKKSYLGSVIGKNIPDPQHCLLQV
jgi:hypothetical protein